MSEISFDAIVADIEPPDFDATKAASNALAVGTFYTTLRKLGVPAAAAREFTAEWMAACVDNESE